MLEFYFVQFVHKVRFQVAGGSNRGGKSGEFKIYCWVFKLSLKPYIWKFHICDTFGRGRQRIVFNPFPAKGFPIDE